MAYNDRIVAWTTLNAAVQSNAATLVSTMAGVSLNTISNANITAINAAIAAISAALVAANAGLTAHDDS